MWIYWTLFWWPALSALRGFQMRASDSVRKLSMSALALALTLIIGLRFQVGVDWDQYLNYVDVANSLEFVEVVLGGDPAYGLLNWVAARTGYGIWLVNLVSAIVFVSGLFVFCRTLPNPWLALTVAMPFMALVMAMNYTRQGAAFGLELWALAALRNGSTLRFLAFIALAATFHKTAAILMPLALLSRSISRFWTVVLICASVALGYIVFLSELIMSLYGYYITEEWNSAGAAIRVYMNSVAAVVFLLIRDRTRMDPADKLFWTRFSLVTLIFIPALALSPSSTIVDRVALYFMPIQLVAFSYLPNIAARWGLRLPATLFVVAGYWLVMFVWFNYGVHASWWLPYRFYPLEQP